MLETVAGCQRLSAAASSSRYSSQLLVLTALPASANAAVVSKSGDPRAYLLDFVSGIPGRGSEGYDRPSSSEASAITPVLR